MIPDVRSLKVNTFEQGEPTLFSIVRNEIALLPEFIGHYRNLGINQFIFYDDHSKDGTLEYLLDQENTSVLTSDTNFGEVVGRYNNGTDMRFVHWLKANIPVKFVPEGWVLVADADEFLVLPKEFPSLLECIRHLEIQRISHMTAAMVELYPLTLSQRNSPVGNSEISQAIFFDQGPYHEFEDGSYEPAIKFERGIISRLLLQLNSQYPELVESILSEYGVGLNAPKSWKVPLINNGAGARHLHDHAIYEVPNLDISGALLHYKFTSNLD
ncbi:MAG: glycosyltransferase family 2 protein, partial [Actinomycetes bacterium]